MLVEKKKVFFSLEACCLLPYPSLLVFSLLYLVVGLFGRNGFVVYEAASVKYRTGFIEQKHCIIYDFRIEMYF